LGDRLGQPSAAGIEQNMHQEPIPQKNGFKHPLEYKDHYFDHSLFIIELVNFPNTNDN
jgi:hypothetical protein